MKKNVGKLDKKIRIVVGIVLMLLGLWLMISPLGIILLIGGLALILTGVFSFCGLYTILGINTCKAMPEEKNK